LGEAIELQLQQRQVS